MLGNYSAETKKISNELAIKKVKSIERTPVTKNEQARNLDRLLSIEEESKREGFFDGDESPLPESINQFTFDEPSDTNQPTEKSTKQAEVE